MFITARTASVFVSSTTVHIYDFHIFTVLKFVFPTLEKRFEYLSPVGSSVMTDPEERIDGQ